jgi:hypothetical protein
MGLPPQAQQQLLLSLLESARKHSTETNQRATQATVDMAKEKTQYFEKIALASGGTIALVVSFVGAHAGRLQPPWLLRSALIVLVLAMVSAMYRNWRYPFYIMGSYGRQYMEARRDKGRRERDYVTAFPALAREEDGTPIDLAQFQTRFTTDEGIFRTKIEECEKQEKSAFNTVKVVEYLTLTLVVLGMALLVVLAWKNF